MRFKKEVKLKIKVASVEDFWEWVSGDFLENLKAVSYYNGDTFANINLYLDDVSSVLIGYPSLRQLRTKNSIF